MSNNSLSRSTVYDSEFQTVESIMLEAFVRYSSLLLQVNINISVCNCITLSSAEARGRQVTSDKREADLALRQEVGHHCSFDSIINISIFKDDDRGFPSKLQRHLLDSLTCHSIFKQLLIYPDTK